MAKRDQRAGDDAATGGAAAPGGDGGAPTDPIPASYEQARDELAGVVAALEEGGLTLDESLALWERGQALAAACERFLAGARERVEAALAGADQPDEDDTDQP
jgi:exodeoxyribonuclease VII small subunit